VIRQPAARSHIRVCARQGHRSHNVISALPVPGVDPRPEKIDALEVTMPVQAANNPAPSPSYGLAHARQHIWCRPGFSPGQTRSAS